MRDQEFLGWGIYQYNDYAFSYWGDKIITYHNWLSQGVWRVKTLK
jgi:hypothetical protein